MDTSLATLATILLIAAIPLWAALAPGCFFGLLALGVYILLCATGHGVLAGIGKLTGSPQRHV